MRWHRFGNLPCVAILNAIDVVLSLMNLIGTILVYAGLLASLLGAVSLVRPLRFLGIASRASGVAVFLFGGGAILIAVYLPARETKVAERKSALDDFARVYEFSEFHSIRIHASRDRVFRSILDVTPEEITLFRALTWIRRGGQSGKDNILNAPPGEPILSVALRTSFMKLAEEPGREIVVGTLVAAPKEVASDELRVARFKQQPTPDNFKTLRAPGFALGVMNFRLEDAANGETLVTTETRVHTTDASTRRRFAAYWRVIYPGSALIRVMWLRAIRTRADRPSSS